MEKTYVIRNRYTNKPIFAFKCESFSLCVQIAIEFKINLYRANLSEANLYRANLYRANLSEANLSEANLSEANLYRANLSEANLYRANLSEANLSEANLSEANLYRANLSEANLSEANLSEANLDFSTGFNLSCKGLNLKLDRKQIIQYLFHIGSNMKHYLSENKDEDLETVLNIAKKLQDEFHRINEVGRL